MVCGARDRRGADRRRVTRMRPTTVAAWFRETLRGGLVLGAADPRNLPDGPALDLTLQLVVSVPEVGSFVEDENHPASVAGYVRCPQWPGPREI